MRRTVKRESEATDEGNVRRDVDEPGRFRSVKREKQKNKGIAVSVRIEVPPSQEEEQRISDRRILRSQYLALMNKISVSKDDLTRVDSHKFSQIFREFENLHQKVQKPREQVADAEAFLDIANTIMSSGFFSQASLGIDADVTAPGSIKWKDLGLAVCSTVLVSCGCSTMWILTSLDMKDEFGLKKMKPDKSTQSKGKGVRFAHLSLKKSENKAVGVVKASQISTIEPMINVMVKQDGNYSFEIDRKTMRGDLGRAINF